jgi:hypothetical protein
VEKMKKMSVGRRGPTVNVRRGDYNGNNIISNKTSKHNPTGNVRTICAYPIPMTVKQEANIGATIKL